MPCWWVRIPVEQLQPFERVCTVGIQETGWTYQRIAANVGYNVSVVCRCFQQWSMESSHTRRPCVGWPHSTDIRQDQCIMRAVMAAQTASREEIRAHVAPVVSLRAIGYCLLAAGLRSRVPLARLPLTLQHHQAWLLWCCGRLYWRVEWRSVIFSDESRFCLDVHM